MQFDEVVQYGHALWRLARAQGAAPEAPVTLLGKPGIGKSAATRGVAAEIASELGREVHDLVRPLPQGGKVEDLVLFYAADLSSFLPEDLSGLPMPREEELEGRKVLVTRYASNSWLEPFCRPGAVGVLCLDDLPAAAPAVAIAARQLVLDRRVGQHRLSDGVLLFVTGNRREDGAGASKLPSHFCNVVQLMELDSSFGSAFPGWHKWYRGQGLAPEVPAFLLYKNALFSKAPRDADRLGAYPTPRSWAKLGAVLPAAQEVGLVSTAAAALVGEGAGSEFAAYVKVRSELVSPKEVLKDFRRALPNPGETLSSPDRRHAMASGLAETAVALSKDKRLSPTARAKLAVSFVRAVGWVTEGNREYVATSVSTWIASGGSMAALTLALRDGKDDPLVAACAQYIAKALR